MDKSEKTNFEAMNCKGCNHLYHPPRYHCHACGMSEFEKTALSGEGEIYCFTRIWVGSEGMDDSGPYVFGEIRLEEGLVVPGRILKDNLEHDIEIGTRVFFKEKKNGVNWFERWPR